MLSVFPLVIFISLLKAGLANPSCPTVEPGMTNVHLVCHTHDDVGWLKTVDQYYYGSKKDITWVGVQYILDSVVDSLLKDSKRKFVYVESAFFFLWWEQQDELMKNDVKYLVENGQLEFIGGGWSMNDEASTHYNAIIDQMTLGLAKLNETFGASAVPRIAWQIDPFGHSKEQASLFAQMGMDALFFSRLDHDDKTKRWDTKEMEMIWQASNSLEEEAWLFTGVLPNHYSPPSGFCFDLLCNDDPIMDDPDLEDYNKDEMVDKFLLAVEDELAAYTTSNIIMTMGEDFQYMNAEVWYKNLDKLIKYVNERQATGSLVNVMYSTPSCYVDALHDAGIAWPTKQDDFFPYSSDPHAYWTGYFTSRPTLKGFIRQSNNLLQAVKQISALTATDPGTSIEALSKAVGVAQHHDAVTGTAKQAVTDDYAKRLASGTASVQDILNEGFGVLTGSGIEDFEYCPLLNISSCAPTESLDSFVVNVYNPLSRTRSFYVRIPVVYEFTYEVTDFLGNILEVQMVPISLQVKDIPGRESLAQFELVFYAENLPALDAVQFLVSRTSSVIDADEIKPRPVGYEEDTIIEKGRVSLTLDPKTKMMKSIGVKSKIEPQEMKVTQKWLWYAGASGDNSIPEKRSSGAYIFRPDGSANEITEGINATYYDGPLLSEVHQTWGSWVSQVLRLYKDKDYVEVEWLVGPIPVTDDIGKEVITRYEWGNMSTGNTFYTDANGREMQKRVLDHRDTWELSSSEPESQNYYPVTSRLILQSLNGMGKAAVLNDRAQGGTSLSDGVAELMVHRRLLHDDSFGVSEALNEMAYGQGLVARGRHFLVHSDFNTLECDFGCQHRNLGEELLLQPVITISSPSSFARKAVPKASSLSSSLPPNIRVLTLEPWGQGKWLLRLENFYEVDESSHSGTSTVDIVNMFSDWTITDIDEVTLGANQLKKDNSRLTWNVASKDEEETQKRKSKIRTFEEPLAEYSFSPMQIRSFIVQVSRK